MYRPAQPLVSQQHLAAYSRVQHITNNTDQSCTHTFQRPITIPECLQHGWAIWLHSYMGAIRLQTLAAQLTTRKRRMQLRLGRQEGRGVDTAQNCMKLYKNT